jgi:hypothetical protein
VHAAQAVTDRELRDAIEAADLPPRDYRIFGALLYRVEWGHDYIPAQFQDRSLEALASRCRMSKAGAVEGLNHLERHGWVRRERQPPGRGRATHYVVAIGADCDCPKVPKPRAPMNEAQRSRRYRERKSVQNPRDGEDEGSSIHVTKRPGERDEDAGQTPDSAEMAVTRGVGEGRTFVPVWALPRPAPVESWKVWPADSIGAEVNGAT